MIEDLLSIPTPSFICLSWRHIYTQSVKEEIPSVYLPLIETEYVSIDIHRYHVKLSIYIQ
jgi:hypothetical protein